MTPEGWIAAAALALTVLGILGAGVWRVAQMFGLMRQQFTELPGMIATAVNAGIREHEDCNCSNFEPTTGVQIQALQDYRDRAITAPGGIPRYRGKIEP